MSAPKLSEPLDFLVRRKFPTYDSFFKPAPTDFPDSLKEFARKSAEAAAAYLIELRSLPSDELDRRYAEEKAKKKAEDAAAAEKAELELVFHQPSAAADFSYWSKASYWTQDEAVALSLGKSPTLINWEVVKPYLQYSYNERIHRIIRCSPFALQYQQVRELVARAVHMRELIEPLSPVKFMQWCDFRDLTFPDELAGRLTPQIGTDWKKEFDALEQRYAELSAILEDKGKREVESAVSLALERAKTMAVSPVPDQTLSTREKESLLKLIIGMAVRGYKYNPLASRNDATKEIAEDLEHLGIRLDVDTVRKWLKEATEFLPQNTDEK